jgi:phosphatidylinositol 3-kinase
VAFIGDTVVGRTLRRGKHRLLLWQGKEADGSMETTTPSKSGTEDEMGRLEKVRLSLSIETASDLKGRCAFQLVKKHERGDMPKSEWLDKLVFRRMSEIHAVRTFMPFRVVHTAKGNKGGD